MPKPNHTPQDVDTCQSFVRSHPMRAGAELAALRAFVYEVSRLDSDNEGGEHGLAVCIDDTAADAGRLLDGFKASARMAGWPYTVRERPRAQYGARLRVWPIPLHDGPGDQPRAFGCWPRLRWYLEDMQTGRLMHSQGFPTRGAAECAALAWGYEVAL